MTEQQLKAFDGAHGDKPMYVAIKGHIFDVNAGKSFYVPNGDYAAFPGKDASRALAKMSKNDEDVCGSLDGLSDKELGVLADWEKKFEAKYLVVGRLAKFRSTTALFTYSNFVIVALLGCTYMITL